MMGSPDSDKDAVDDEKPQHPVRITKPFYLGKYPVTQEQWEVVMGSNPSHFKGPKNPVEQVSWNDCQKFLKRLNEKVGGGNFSLPTEAHWEYACRAGSSTKYCFSTSVTTRQSWANMRGITGTRAAGRTRSARRGRTPGGCMTCTATCGSGARSIGITTITMRRRQRTQGAQTVCAVAAVGTILRGTAARRSASSSCPSAGLTSWACVYPE